MLVKHKEKSDEGKSGEKKDARNNSLINGRGFCWFFSNHSFSYLTMLF